MLKSPSYFTLEELVAQRNNALAFGYKVDDLEGEIALQVEFETNAASNVSVLPRPFDWERD